MKRRDALLLATLAALRPFRSIAAWSRRCRLQCEIAPGNYVRQGAHEEATAENQDGIANIGFIVGDTSVAISILAAAVRWRGACAHPCASSTD